MTKQKQINRAKVLLKRGKLETELVKIKTGLTSREIDKIKRNTRLEN